VQRRRGGGFAATFLRRALFRMHWLAFGLASFSHRSQYPPMARGEIRSSTVIFRAVTWAMGLVSLLFAVSSLYFFTSASHVRASIAFAKETISKYADQELIFKEILDDLFKTAIKEPAIYEFVTRSGYTLQSVADSQGRPSVAPAQQPALPPPGAKP